MRRLGSAVDGVLERMGLAKVVEQHEVFRKWQDIVGPVIARAARPYRVDGETLIVRVANSTWMNELSLRQGELLKRLNAGRTHSAVRRLIFRLDPEADGSTTGEGGGEINRTTREPADISGGSGWQKRT